MCTPLAFSVGRSSLTAWTAAFCAFAEMVVVTRRPPPSISASVKPSARRCSFTSASR